MALKKLHRTKFINILTVIHSEFQLLSFLMFAPKMIYMLFLGTPKKSDIFFIISLFALPCFGSDLIAIIISFPFT
jgi:hypothetical protein